MSTMDDRDRILALRQQVSGLYGVVALSIMLFDQVVDEEILELLTSAVPAFGRCRLEGTYLVRDQPALGVESGSEPWTELNALAGVDGPVSVPGATWAWAYPIRSVAGHSGYLVVSAEATPSTDEQFLVRTLARQAGAALNSAALYRAERAASGELRERNAELASVNDTLTHAVADLERRSRIHELLINVVATGGGEGAIAAVLHELTGLAVVVEDKFGHLLAWAGGEHPASDRPRAARDRTELLNRVRRNGRPLRERDRVLAVAQPRDEVLGVLALIDPSRAAGPYETLALEYAAVVLAMELAHQRSLAETELRLRGDLVDDLLTGTDDESAIARSAALDHDLYLPHQILAISWTGSDKPEKVGRAVDQAIGRITQARALISRRGGKIMVVAPTRGDTVEYEWRELHRLVSHALPYAEIAIGVGRPRANPSDLPRSHTEAHRALGVRRSQANHNGVTTFDELGFYRMVGTAETEHEVAEFIREWLGLLIDYDATHHYDLVTTLWQYYECGGNYDATAHALLIHRSTLRYRLRRIRELTGYDLRAVDTHLNLHIATRAWQIRNGPE
jgi:sugar diacid utilization regulator